MHALRQIKGDEKARRRSDIECAAKNMSMQMRSSIAFRLYAVQQHCAAQRTHVHETRQLGVRTPCLHFDTIDC